MTAPGREGSTLSLLFGYVRPYRGRIALGVLASLGVALADAATAKLIQPFIDRILVARDPGLVTIVPFAVVGIAAFKGVSRYSQEYLIRTSGQLVVQRIRNDLYGHSISQSMRFFSDSSAGSLMSKILNDVGVLQSAVSQAVVSAVQEGATLAGLTLVAFYNDWRLATVAFVVLPLAVLPASAIGRKIKSYSRRGQGAMGDLTATLEQTFSGIKVIKAFGTESQETARFEEENRRYYHFLRKLIKYDSASSPVMEILASVGVAVVIWFGMHRVLAGAMTQGELFSTLAAILLMYTPMKRLGRVNNTLQQGAGAADRVFEVLRTRQEILDRPGALVLPRVRGEVAFEGVDFAYRDEPVLRSFTLTASPGEVVALVGPSGAGKSTVAGLLARFYDPRNGAVRIDGHDLREVTQASLKANIALVDQETFLFHDTIAGNIRYGRPDAGPDDIVAAARQAYADDFIRLLPEGYDTQVGDRGVRLSGGQRQRLCIARALLKDAPVLILDEATSALDTESEAMVQQALANLMKNRTTLVIAHRLSTIMHADRIVVMEEGRIRESGRHRELLQRDGLYRRLFEMQFGESR